MNSSRKRIVITGRGMVSALGNDVEGVFDKLLAGESAVKYMSHWPVPLCAAPIDAAPLDAQNILSRAERRSMGPLSIYTALAAKKALSDSGLKELPPERTACVIGSTLGSSNVLEETFRTLLLGKGMQDVSPMNFFKCASHTAAYNCANVLGITGMVYAPAAACASALHALGLAASLITSGECDAAVAGGSEELSHMVSESFLLMDAHAEHTDPAQLAPRPFDRDRSGLVCGEGSGILILEEYEHARKRGAVIYGEITGYATNRGSNTVTQSESGAVASCLRLLEKKCSGQHLHGVGYINAHATGTVQGDQAEAQALGTIFGKEVPASSLKGHLGHTLGACGAIELILTLEMMKRSLILPTRNLVHPAADCTVIDAVTQVREKRFDSFIKNAFAFGSINAAMLCSKV